MKKAYVLIGLFGIWCLVIALWYLFSVRDINSSQINPRESGLAIAEIMIMTLVSVLLGFGIAWYMREETLSYKQKDILALLTMRENMLKELHDQKERAKKADHTLERARQTFHDDYIQLSRERDRLKEEKTTTQNELSKLNDEGTMLQIQLGNEKQKVAELTASLVAQQQQIDQKEKENAGVRYFINPFNIAASIEKNDIDDLKMIKGIGPVIEKKLNMLGIVNFKQISEFTDEAVTQIAQTLKFFPDRIKRDHWVQQATELSKSK